MQYWEICQRRKFSPIEAQEIPELIAAIMQTCTLIEKHYKLIKNQARKNVTKSFNSTMWHRSCREKRKPKNKKKKVHLYLRYHKTQEEIPHLPFPQFLHGYASKFSLLHVQSFRFSKCKLIQQMLIYICNSLCQNHMQSDHI